MAKNDPEKKKILLVVEDNILNMELIKALLESNDYNVLEAFNSEDAMKHITTSSTEIDLILMDLQLPDKSGFEIIDQLKQDPVTKDIPIMVVTAHANLAYKNRALESGCVDYITKPIDLDNFMTVINTHFENNK